MVSALVDDLERVQVAEAAHELLHRGADGGQRQEEGVETLDKSSEISARLVLHKLHTPGERGEVKRREQ